jgi:hypothetical protein
VKEATTLQLLGAGGFGALIGWYVYYINRYRTDAVQAADIVTLLGAIGGAAVLNLFPAESDLFGAYGIGLFLGFFGYFVVLVVLVLRSGGVFTGTWFLDGRRRRPSAEEVGGDQTGRAMRVPRRGGDPGAEPDERV